MLNNDIGHMTPLPDVKRILAQHYIYDDTLFTRTGMRKYSCKCHINVKFYGICSTLPRGVGNIYWPFIGRNNIERIQLMELTST